MLWKIKFIFEASIGMKTLSSRQVLLMKCTWHERTIRKRLNKYFLGRVVRRKLLLAKKNIATQLRLAKLRHETSKTKAFGHTRPKRRCLATTHSATLAQILHPTNKHDCFCSHKTRAPYSNWINHNPPCIYPINSRMAPEETKCCSGPVSGQSRPQLDWNAVTRDLCINKCPPNSKKLSSLVKNSGRKFLHSNERDWIIHTYTYRWF